MSTFPHLDPEKLVTFTIYGEEITGPETNNLRGQIYQVFDSAGLLQSNGFDFKGNLLESSRRYAKEYKTTPDWSVLPTAPDIDAAAAPLPENETFTQQMAYDALNRPTAMTMPNNSVVRPTYNEANLLEAVEANLRGSGTATSFVTNIDYNARGQREKIVYGNSNQTRYTDDPNTLSKRLKGKDLLGFDSRITEARTELQSILKEIKMKELRNDLNKFGSEGYLKVLDVMLRQ